MTSRCPQIVYNHQTFNSTDAFVRAYRSGTLRRLPKRPDQDPSRTDYAWSTRKRPAGARDRDLDDRPGPRSVSFAGVRFRLDKKQGYVSWMGWGVYLGFDRDMGMSLWDVRFRGERIVYEVRFLPGSAVCRTLRVSTALAAGGHCAVR
jgi:primary-amine oxidase